MPDSLLYRKELPSGATCYIIPKKGYASARCMACVRYGAMDSAFTATGARHDLPPGAAHFLEHKLFEGEPGEPGVFETFAALGAEVNAFTTASSTAFYFDAVENVEDGLRALLEFVYHPHLTDENVEKEKGIITQEIRMYDDDPQWASYLGVLEAAYAVHPARGNIAGTAESVAALDKETLALCHRTFYTPRNMAIICAGNFADKDALFDLIERNVSLLSADVTRNYGEEPSQISKEFAVRKMNLPRPVFHIGIKDIAPMKSPCDAAAARVLLDLLCGESSSLYADLFDKGLIDERFGGDILTDADLALSVYAGESDAPQKVYESLLAEIGRVKRVGFDPVDFARLKAKHTGQFLRGLNSIDALVPAQCGYFTRGTDFVRILEAYKRLTYDDVAERLADFGGDKQTVLSVAE